MVGLSRKRVFPKTKGDSITGQDRAQKHCDFRFSQIEKKSKVAVLQLDQDELQDDLFDSCDWVKTGYWSILYKNVNIFNMEMSNMNTIIK